jgi:hypothetical protein
MDESGSESFPVATLVLVLLSFLVVISHCHAIYYELIINFPNNPVIRCSKVRLHTYFVITPAKEDCDLIIACLCCMSVTDASCFNKSD